MGEEEVRSSVQVVRGSFPSAFKTSPKSANYRIKKKTNSPYAAANGGGMPLVGYSFLSSIKKCLSFCMKRLIGDPYAREDCSLRTLWTEKIWYSLPFCSACLPPTPRLCNRLIAVQLRAEFGRKGSCRLKAGVKRLICRNIQ